MRCLQATAQNQSQSPSLYLGWGNIGGGTLDDPGLNINN